MADIELLRRIAVALEKIAERTDPEWQAEALARAAEEKSIEVTIRWCDDVRRHVDALWRRATEARGPLAVAGGCSKATVWEVERKLKHSASWLLRSTLTQGDVAGLRASSLEFNEPEILARFRGGKRRAVLDAWLERAV